METLFIGVEPEQLFDLSTYLHASLFQGCLYSWEALNRLNTYLSQLPLGKIEVEIPSGVHLISPETISIGKGSVIEPGAYIQGPCVIGKYCTVRQGAYIRGNVLIGDYCVIGHTTELKKVIFLDHAAAAHFAYLGDTILGNRVNLGAGTKCANLRLDHGIVLIHTSEKVVVSGLKKLGAILGDDTQVGCNCVTNPGTITGKGSWIYPCVNFGGVLPAKSLVKPAHTAHISQRK